MRLKLVKRAGETIKVFGATSSLIPISRDEIDVDALIRALPAIKAIPAQSEQKYYLVDYLFFELGPGEYIVATSGYGYLEYRRLTVFQSDPPTYMLGTKRTVAL